MLSPHSFWAMLTGETLACLHVERESFHRLSGKVNPRVPHTVVNPWWPGGNWISDSHTLHRSC